MFTTAMWTRNSAYAIAAICVLTLVSWAGQAVAADETVAVVNPITLNPATPNPVTIVNPPNAPSTVSLNPNTPNPVTIAKPLKVNRYQDFAQPLSCPSAGSCTAVFSTVPVETLILHVSCDFLLPTGASVFSVFVQPNGLAPGAHQVVQAFTSSAPAAGFLSGGVNADTYLFVEAGDQPTIFVNPNGGAVSELDCTVSGNQNG